MEVKDFSNAKMVWKPLESNGCNINQFMEKIRRKYKVKIDDYWELHQWSVENISDFWEEMWTTLGIIHSKPYDQVLDMNAKFSDRPEWFRGTRLNYAENLLRYRDDRVAFYVAGEDRETKVISYAEVYKEACAYGGALRKAGVKSGDIIMCYMSNREEAIYAVLGAASIGAIWSAVLPLLGAEAVLNRCAEIKPKILFTVDRFQYDNEEKDMLKKLQVVSNGLPSLEKVIIVPSKEDSLKKDIQMIKNSCFLGEFLDTAKLQDGSVPPLEFEHLSFSHPVFISYTSGTTGTPKALVHGIGSLLLVLRDYYCLDETRDSCYLSTTSPGWSSWIMRLSSLAFGMKTVLFEGIPFFIHPTYLWDMVDEFKITRLTLIPKVSDELQKRNYVPSPKNHLTSLKTITNSASVIKPQIYDFVYKKIKPDICLSTVYGSTEIMGCSFLALETLPIYQEELTLPALGMSSSCFDDKGNSVVGKLGELVITKPFPSFPLGILGDEDGRKFKETYFNKYPDAFSQGDLCLVNPVTKGVFIYGRSDNTLKFKRERFCSSEIYNVVGTFPEVLDSVCVSKYSRLDTDKIILFLKMMEGKNISKDLVERIKEAIERELSKFHMPDIIIETKGIPYNINGKKLEVTVKHIINGLPYNSESVINPDCLQNYCNIPELKNI